MMAAALRLASHHDAPASDRSMLRPRLSPDDSITAPIDSRIDERVDRIVGEWARSPVLRVERGDPRDRLPSTLPRAGVPLEEALAEVDGVLSENRRRNAHPGMFGYVCGAGLPTDPLAHALTAAYAQNVTSFGSAPGATAIELRLAEWFRACVGLPSEASGQVLSGGSASNLAALTVALHRVASPSEGLFGGPRPIVYASAQAHFSILRAVRLLGLGRNGLRFVDERPDGTMDVARLREWVERDRASGARPTAVIATAGTTVRGAIDPLADIADLCAAEGLYMHVDAAYGGAIAISPRLAPALRGIARADSVTIDLHKWLFTTFDASLILYRSAEDPRRAFFQRADYALSPTRESLRTFGFYHQSWETSRRFRALAPWLALRHYGADRLARNIEFNVDCAAWLGHRVEGEPWLELATAPSLSICTFRVRPPGASDRVADRVTETVRERLEREGEFFLSAANVAGRPVLRVCVLSPNTTADTIDALVEACLHHGRTAAAEHHD